MIIDPQNKEKDILINLIEPQGKRILEIGCGSGRVSLILAQFAECYVAIDNDPVSIKKATSQITPSLEGKIEFKIASAVDISLPDNSFDVVFMLLSFHEIAMPEQERALLEALRIVKSGGKIIIIDPEENPVDSVQALFNVISSQLRLSNHPLLVNHAKKVIDIVSKEMGLKINKDIKYSIEWQFKNFEDLLESMTAECPDIKWNKSNKEIAGRILRDIVKNKNISDQFIILDRMEVTVIYKK